MIATDQEVFDSTIGQLDRALSMLIAFAGDHLDRANIQTLKHHAEDMIGAGKKILEVLDGSR